MVLLPIVDQARGADPVGIQNVASFLAEIAPDYAKRLRTLPSAGQASL